MNGIYTIFRLPRHWKAETLEKKMKKIKIISDYFEQVRGIDPWFSTLLAAVAVPYINEHNMERK